MQIEQRVLDHLEQLLTEGIELAVGMPSGQVRDSAHSAACIGWISAAHNAVALVCQSPSHPYRAATARIDEGARGRGWVVNEAVGELAQIIKRLIVDVRAGVLGSIADAARGETLDDLLDQAAEYHRRQQKQGAGVLASAVFEDTVRQIARKHAVGAAGDKLDALIIALEKGGMITALVAKRSRAAAGLRNHAQHADWDAYTLADVLPVLALTRELIVAHLAS
jgi:hypothetical protein